MIISNSLEFIFIHIHKTAGNSISEALEPVLRWNDIVCGGTEFGEKLASLYSRQYGLHKHSNAKEIKKIVGEEVWKNYFTFSFVRNPYYRTISNYTYFKMLVKKQGAKRFFRRFDKNNKLWQWAAIKAVLASKNFSQFIRQTEFIEKAPAGKPLFNSLSEESKIIVDYIGKVEKINEDFKHISNVIKQYNLKVGKRNVSRKKVKLEEFYRTQADLDHVYELYRKDFDFFNYERILYNSMN